METKPICVIKVDNQGNEFEEIYKIQQQMTDEGNRLHSSDRWVSFFHNCQRLKPKNRLKTYLFIIRLFKL